jgi:2-haloacid dehalogenase
MTSPLPFDAAVLRLLVFDVFGTVVDWRSGVARDVEALALGLDGAAFADAWRARYQPAMEQVRSGRRPWVSLDVLHRENLDVLLHDSGVADRVDEPARQALNRAWHRLDPWPEARAGLARLKRRFVVAPLSNGNIALLTNMAKRTALPWDCVLSAEVFRAYKPDPRTYLGAAEVFALRPEQVMMVAAHPGDLRAAAACGLRTAFVERPLEFGPGRRGDRPGPDDRFDLYTTGLDELAQRLDC